MEVIDKESDIVYTQVVYLLGIIIATLYLSLFFYIIEPLQCNMGQWVDVRAEYQCTNLHK